MSLNLIKRVDNFLQKCKEIHNIDSIPNNLSLLWNEYIIDEDYDDETLLKDFDYGMITFFHNKLTNITNQDKTKLLKLLSKFIDQLLKNKCIDTDQRNDTGILKLNSFQECRFSTTPRDSEVTVDEFPMANTKELTNDASNYLMAIQYLCNHEVSFTNPMNNIKDNNGLFSEENKPRIHAEPTIYSNNAKAFGDCMKPELGPLNIISNANPSVSVSLNVEQKKELLLKNNIDRRKKYNKLVLLMNKKQNIEYNISQNIVKLFIEFEYNDNKYQGRGTGIILKDNKDRIYVITAAHNVLMYCKLNDEYIKAKSVWFFNDGRQIKGNKYYIYPIYLVNDDGNDIAILEFKNTESGIAKYHDVSSYISDVSELNGDYIGYVLGFPGENGDNDMNIYGMQGKIMLKSDGNNKNNVLYDIDTTEGQSGSIVLCQVNNEYKIIGIHSFGDELNIINCGTKFDKNKCEWIKNVVSHQLYTQQTFTKSKNSAKSPSKLFSDTHDVSVVTILGTILCCLIALLRIIIEKASRVSGWNTIHKSLQYSKQMNTKSMNNPN